MKINDILTELSWDEAKRVEQYLDRMFKNLGLDVEFSKHFLDRVVDEDDYRRDGYSSARDSDVSKEELIDAFTHLKQKYGRKLYMARKNPREFSAILKDVSTDLNIPFTIDYDKVEKKMHELRAITAMRKKHFVSNQGEPTLRV